MDDLLNNAPCGFLSFSDDGTILLSNRTLRELLGYEPGALEGRRVESILTVAGRIFYQTHFFPLLKLHGKAEEIYLTVRTRTGGEVPVLINAIRRGHASAASPAEASSMANPPPPNPTTAEVFTTDCVLMPIRQRNQYEDEILAAKKAAEAAGRAKDEFLAVVSHELRTPLTAILGWSRLVRTGQLDTETINRALETIERNALSQSQLIEDILDFARIISGKLRLNVQPVQPVDAIEAALEVVRPTADAKGIRLQPVLDPKAGPVSGDPDRLQQVLWNLLTNAIKFTPKGERVQVRLQRINSHVEITVSDTGQGISAEFLPYVFERFRQADNTTTRTHTGLGLGLALTRHIVELHGGTIRAFSPGAGQGSTFTVELPVMIMHRADVIAPDATEPKLLKEGDSDLMAGLPRLDGLHVLVVDDVPDAREVIVMVLTQAGALVTATGTVSDALEQLQGTPPDLLISDIEMPGQDGYNLIRQVRASARPQLKSIPAIALTAHARAEDRRQAALAGFQVHFTKPIDPAELVGAVASLTGRTGTTGD